MNELFTLEGNVAVVTGSTRGIGKEVAIGYAKSGADLCIVGRDEEKLSAVKMEIDSLGKKCLALNLDISSLDDITKMAEKTFQEYGKIDILANIAGVNVHKAAEEMTEEDWDFVQNVNLKTLFFCCKEVGKIMLQAGSGKIINMSSTFALVGFWGRTAYASSKAGVSNLTKTLAIEWSGKGINVNAIAPGPVWTEARDHLFSDETFYNNLVSKLPINRVADPIDIVGPAIFLASPASSFMTGETILVDGGYCAN